MKRRRRRPWRTPTWGECQAAGLGSEVPCPHESCRHHVCGPAGQTCVLRIVEDGPLSHKDIAAILHSSVRQVQRDFQHGIERCVEVMQLERPRARTLRSVVLSHEDDEEAVRMDSRDLMRELNQEPEHELPHGHGPCRRLTREEIARLYLAWPFRRISMHEDEEEELEPIELGWAWTPERPEDPPPLLYDHKGRVLVPGRHPIGFRGPS